MLCDLLALPASPFSSGRGAADARPLHACLCPQMASMHLGLRVETWEWNKSNVRETLSG